MHIIKNMVYAIAERFLGKCCGKRSENSFPFDHNCIRKLAFVKIVSGSICNWVSLVKTFITAK